ncbi:MAG: hypothetical protein IPL52_14690 [Flavobacteriales bacterium]|nr:hypothetical protein [Flavobacteriales bacterium]
MRTPVFSILAAVVFVACGDPQPANETQPAIVADTTTQPVTEGHQVLYTKDGGRLEGELHNGMRAGPWASYFPNGGIRSRSTYVDGLEEGPTEVYHENGLTYYTGTYLKGNSIGEWIFYDPQGNEVKRVSYDSLGVMLK